MSMFDGAEIKRRVSEIINKLNELRRGVSNDEWEGEIAPELFNIIGYTGEEFEVEFPVCECDEE